MSDEVKQKVLCPRPLIGRSPAAHRPLAAAHRPLSGRSASSPLAVPPAAVKSAVSPAPLPGATSRRHFLSDLRESGSIEHDADQVWMLYREGVYNPDGDNVNLTDLFVRKNRNGATGRISLRSTRSGWDSSPPARMIVSNRS